jgi:peptide/nickel transport system substrate-binding protein
MSWGPEDLVFQLELNQSEEYGVKDDRDRAIRQLFREDKFRQALSHAMDREGIAQSLMRGPFLRAFPGGLVPGSPEYDRSSTVYYPYNVDMAKQLLAEIGLEDSDNNGILNFSEGPLAGQDVVVSLNTSQDAAETQSIGDQLVAMFGAVGIKVNARPMTSQANTDFNASGEWDMRMTRPDDYLLPLTRCNNLAPVTPQTPGWNREGDVPRVLRDWEQDLADTIKAYCSERDTAKRKELINHWNFVWTSHNYALGTIIGRHGLALANRFKNVPGGTPTYMYTWVEDAILSEQVWTPIEDQKEQVRPNTIPEYSN